MSADLTIPTETLAGIRASVQTTMRLRVDIYRPALVSGSQAGAPSLVAEDVPLSAWSPSREPQLALLADLGGGRARQLGIVPYNTDVRPGDECYIVGGTVAYQVHGVGEPADVLIVALSKRENATAPESGGGSWRLDFSQAGNSGYVGAI